MKLFLSYARDDVEFARELHAYLNVTRGISSIFSNEAFRSGLEHREQLSKAIKQHDLFVFLVSANFLTSETCSWEMDIIERSNKPCFYAYIEKCEFADLGYLNNQFSLSHQSAKIVKPVRDYDDRSAAYNTIATKLREKLDDMQKRNSQIIKNAKELAKEAALKQREEQKAFRIVLEEYLNVFDVNIGELKRPRVKGQQLEYFYSDQCISFIPLLLSHDIGLLRNKIDEYFEVMKEASYRTFFIPFNLASPISQDQPVDFDEKEIDKLNMLDKYIRKISNAGKVFLVRVDQVFQDV